MQLRLDEIESGQLCQHWTSNLPPESSPNSTCFCQKRRLEEPLWKSLFQNIDEFFFPKKQPPLVLTSKPIPVKDIWGFYDYKKNGALGSTVAHVFVLAAIIGITLWGRSVVKQIVKPHETVTLISPDDIPPLEPSKTRSGGGGGGGDRDKLAGAERQTSQAIDGANHPSGGGGAQRSSEIAQRSQP